MTIGWTPTQLYKPCLHPPPHPPCPPRATGQTTSLKDHGQHPLPLPPSSISPRKSSTSCHGLLVHAMTLSPSPHPLLAAPNASTLTTDAAGIASNLATSKPTAPGCDLAASPFKRHSRHRPTEYKKQKN